MTQQRTLERGFAAVAAVFLVVVLAALGAFMVSISNTQQLTSAQDIQGTRAYWAAQAGLEWALSALSANPAACPSSPPTTVNTGATFTLFLSCDAQTYTEGTATVTIFKLQSIANTGTVGSAGFVERSLTASYEAH